MNKKSSYFSTNSIFKNILLNYIYNNLMIINRVYVREHITTFSVLIFVIMFGVIVMTKPSFLYNKDGSVREFGIGYKNKTIFPIWLLSIILGIVSYLFVMFYLAKPKLVY
jgi:hypothetical protein